MKEEIKISFYSQFRQA